MTGESGSVSVLDVQDEDGFDENVWGKGEGGRDWIGVEGAVEDLDERVECAKGGKRKF
jgi:hypothetical protein